MNISELPDDEQAVASAAAVEAVEQYRKIKAAKADRERRIDDIRHVLGLANDDAGTVTIYAAQQNSDLTEGKGRAIPRGYFFIEEDAIEASSRLSGVQGTVNDMPVTKLEVYASVSPWLHMIRGNPNVMMRRSG